MNKANTKLCTNVYLKDTYTRSQITMVKTQKMNSILRGFQVIRNFVPLIRGLLTMFIFTTFSVHF